MPRILEVDEKVERLVVFIREYSDGVTQNGHDGNAISQWAAQELIGKLLEIQEIVSSLSTVVGQ